MKRAIFPGTFDPFTIGHLDILEKSIKIFDEVIIAIGKNHDKKIAVVCLLDVKSVTIVSRVRQ